MTTHESVLPAPPLPRVEDDTAAGPGVPIVDFQQCVRCVLDTGDHAQIEFDATGLCNHCRYFDRQLAKLPPDEKTREAVFRQSTDRIKKAGRDKPYDSILGISGGVDSSYLAYLAKRERLRPLVVHFDNGWNSELAVKNIQSIVEQLGFDLQTYVINWEEFKELQLAYLRASVIDIEALTDHAIFGALFRLSNKHRIPFVLSGNNLATEGVLPYAWTYDKLDDINIRDIHRKFGRGVIKTYPFVNESVRRQIRQSRIEVVTLLDYVPYEKADVKKLLSVELGWRDYGGKHHESIFTRFYQGYILPVKFGVDKRKAHLSSLICSGQMTKPEAVEELRHAPYHPAQLQEDRDYVLKKLGLTHDEFDAIMRAPIRNHREFEIRGSFFTRYRAFQPLRPLWQALRPAIMRGAPERP